MDQPAGPSPTTPASSQTPDHAASQRGAGTRWFAPALAAVAAAGFVWRFVHLQRSGIDGSDLFRQGDAVWYSSVAANLADGKLFENPFFGIPTADHPPVTVLVLAPASWLFDSTWSQRMTMVLLGTATIALVGLVGRRLAGPVAGVAAAVLAAASPSLWINDTLLMSETPTALAVAGLILVGANLAERPSMRTGLLAGALCGLAALTRAETGLFLPLMVWPLLARADVGWRQRLWRITAASLATAAVIAPWSLFNLTRFDEPVPISTNDGLTLVGANCDETYRGPITGGWVIDGCIDVVFESLDDDKPPLGPGDEAGVDACVDEAQTREPCHDASTVSRIMRGDALDYIGDNLGEMPRVQLARHGRVWGWWRPDQTAAAGVFEGRDPWASWASYYVTWAMLPLAAWGAVAARRRGASLVPYGAALATVLITTTLFYGLVRFRVPWDVAACVLGGVAVADGLERLRRGSVGPAPSPDADPASPGAPPPSPVPSTPR